MGQKTGVEGNRNEVDPPTWRDLLSGLNAELLGNEEITEFLPGEMVRSGWLGRRGASRVTIAAAERRVGRPLPPSYRAFLAASNGWQCLDWFRVALLPAAEIGWLREIKPQLVEVWDDLNKQPWGEPIPDEEYIVTYQKPRRSYDFRPEHIRDMLVISDTGWNNDNYVWLNPHGIFPDGEWEAWKFIPGEGQASRYRSFWDLMLARLHQQIHDRQSP